MENDTSAPVEAGLSKMTPGMKGEVVYYHKRKGFQWYAVAITSPPIIDANAATMAIPVKYLGYPDAADVHEDELRMLRYPRGSCREMHVGMSTKCRDVVYEKPSVVYGLDLFRYRSARIVSIHGDADDDDAIIGIKFIDGRNVNKPSSPLAKVTVRKTDLLFVNAPLDLADASLSSTEEEGEKKVIVNPDPYKVETDNEDEDPLKVETDSEEFDNGDCRSRRPVTRRKKKRTKVTVNANSNSPTAVQAIDLSSDNADLHQNTKVKLELVKQAFPETNCRKWEEKKTRKTMRLEACRTPITNQPRKVFRRGCAKRCITKILGGCGTNEAPVVENDPAFLPFDINPFLSRGEFYFAGRSDWNPWTPAFPGDVGCMYAQYFQGTNQDGAFHAFLHCSKKRHEPHYLGPNAKGKYLYIGRYRRAPDNDAEDVEFVGKNIRYSEFGTESQWTFASMYHKRDIVMDGENTDDGKVASNAFLHLYHPAAKAEAEDEREGSWNSMSEKKKNTLAWIHMLLDVGFKMKVVPVEYVDYDEALYEKLVEIGADNGEVSVVDGEHGPL